MKRPLRSVMKVLLAVGTTVGAMNTFAASDLDRCNDPRVDRTACLREAAAAQDAKSRGKLNSTGGYDENALARCQSQPAGTARDACEKRVLGTGDTQVRGSVEGGGTIRRNEMQVPASK